MSKVRSPPEYVFEINKRRIKVKHDVSMMSTAWKNNRKKEKVAIVTHVYTEVCSIDQPSECTLLNVLVQT